MSNKPRKDRKRNPRRTLQRVAENQIRKFWCASGHCVDDMQFGGINYSNPSVADVIVDRLLTQPQHWQVWYGAFCRDGDKTWCTFDVHDMGRKCTTNDVADAVEPLIEKLASGVNHKFLVSPGWFAVPCGDIDLRAMSDDIVNRFADWGAFEEEHCRLVWGLRELKREEVA